LKLRKQKEIILKNLWILLLILIAVLALSFLIASCGDDDDDDDSADDDDTDDDDDDTDDDDDDDDDDATGNVTISGLDVGQCIEDEPDATDTPLNVVEVEWRDGALYVFRKNALVNCEVDLEVTGDLASGVLTINEVDSGAVDCLCNANVSYIVNDIPADAGNINLIIDYSPAVKKSWDNVADFNINTNLGNTAWHLAFLEVVIRDGSYPANSNMDMTIGACYLENLAETQIYSAFVNGYVGIFVLDQRALPLNPEAQSAQCSMIDYSMPGLSAGDYNLIGPARENATYTVWVDTNSPMPVE